MKAVQTLPEGYQKIFGVNLQKDKKTALVLNIAALLVGIAMAVPVHFLIPIGTMFSYEEFLLALPIKTLCLALGLIAYIILHELVHGITMKIFGAKKIRYGFTLLYAYAGSTEDYFRKKQYIIIALAPVIIWGIVLGILSFLVPVSWFWIVYIIQIMNISGAAGDVYVTAKFSKLPSDILVNDTGFEMTVYSAKNE